MRHTEKAWRIKNGNVVIKHLNMNNSRKERGVETTLHTTNLMGQLIRVQLFNDDISIYSPSQLFPRLKSITVFICKPQQYSFIRDENEKF